MDNMGFTDGEVFFFSASGGSSAGVLVVDSDRNSRLRLTALLEDDGHSVEQAADGGDVPFACERWSPHIVLLDVATPDVRGLQALVRMKADHRTSNIPVILMSAYADPDLESDFTAMGAEICLDKQAHDSVIRSAVEAVLA